MKQGFRLKKFFEQNVKSLFVLAACLLVLSACSTTALRSYDTTSLAAANETPVYLEVDCNDVSFGKEKLTEANKRIAQAVSDYGFSVVEKDRADFILRLNCRKDSNLNLAIVPNEISGMIMVASITLVPTYWPTELWLDMDVYDLRSFDVEKLETFESSFVSQERVVWAPFILFKLAYDFGLPKYNIEKFYSGLRSSTFALLNEAEGKAIFE
jgi:hypothetical protein